MSVNSTRRWVYQEGLYSPVTIVNRVPDGILKLDYGEGCMTLGAYRKGH